MNCTTSGCPKLTKLILAYFCNKRGQIIKDCYFIKVTSPGPILKTVAAVA